MTETATEPQDVSIEGEPPTLDRVLDDCSLEQGARRGKHPFHTGVLATTRPDGCELRTVVLRSVDSETRSLVVHTDARSDKVRQIRADPRVSWLFYDPRRKVQLRLRGEATLSERSPTAEESERWSERFAVISIRIDRLEWLRLRARGHLRAAFDWSRSPKAHWLVP